MADQGPPQMPFGQLQPLTEDTNFSGWLERLEQFFICNVIPDERKRAFLLTSLGEDAYDTLRNLVSPAKPASKTYDELIQHLTDYYEPKVAIIAERFKFHRRNQEEGETINAFVAELKRLSLKCDFGPYLDEALRDRLVCGLRDDAIQKKLLYETDLSVDKALKIALSMECAAAQAKELRGGPSSGMVNFTKNKNKFQGSGSKRGGPSGTKGQTGGSAGPKRGGSNSEACVGCGGNHPRAQCKFRNSKCYNCNRKGHIAPVCRQQGTTNFLESGSDQADTDGFGSAIDGGRLLHIVSSGNCWKADSSKYVAVLKVNGKPISMTVDTGADWSLVPESTWRDIGSPSLEAPRVSLLTWPPDGSKTIDLVGRAEVPVDFNGKQKSVSLLVARGSGPNLLGKDWLRDFELEDQLCATWSSIHTGVVSHCKEQDPVPARNLDGLLMRYANVFEPGLGAVPGYNVNLELQEGAKPRFIKARPVAFALKPGIDAALDRQEAEGVITKVQFSKWATPIVPVRKPDGSIRVCGDYNISVNPVLKVNQHPLPRKNDLLATLRNGVKFTKLDLRHAYQQLILSEECRELTTINTHRGLYQYNRLPFGIASAPAIFQEFMDQLLAGIPNVSVLLDDILVTGPTETEHLKNLEMVMQRLVEKNLRVQRGKCEFFKDSVDYLGLRVDAAGVRPIPEKVNAILDAPIPENESQLRSFLGFVQYYSHFIPNLATLVEPLNQLLRAGEPWEMTNRRIDCIKQLRAIVTSPKVLVHYDESLPLRLSCDASSVGVGAHLSHIMPDGTERPIDSASRTLTSTERNYAQIEREALSIIFGVKKYRQYLLGRRFTLVTDHQPLVKILGPKSGIPTLAATRLQRWALMLSSYTYDIEFRATGKHANADMLSRLPVNVAPDPLDEIEEAHESTIFHIRQVESLCLTVDQVKTSTRADPLLGRVLGYVQQGWPNEKPTDPNLLPFYHRRTEMATEDGVIFWGSRVVVPNRLRGALLLELHKSHMGVVRMKSLARIHFWWPSLDADIENVASSCTGCAANQNMPNQAPLSPFPYPMRPWQRLHIDFAGPLLGHSFLVIFDAYSKWIEVAAMKSTGSGDVIQVMRSLFSRFGLPDQIVSDNGPQFVSDEFTNYLKNSEIRHTTSAPYCPKSNGAAERVVQTLKSALKKAGTTPSTMQKVVAQFLMDYRQTPHTTTGRAPAELLLGYRPKNRFDLLRPDLRNQVERKVASQKLNHDLKNHRPVHFSVGDRVYARNYRPGEKWVPGTIVDRSSSSVCIVETESGLKWKRHFNQLRYRLEASDQAPKLGHGSSGTWDPDVPSNATNGGGTAAPGQARVTQQRQDQNAVPLQQRRYPERQKKAVDRLGL